MQAVTDDLPEYIAEAEGRTYDSRLPMMVGRHAVVDMGDTARSVGKSHCRLGKGRRRMPQGRDDSVFTQKSGQFVSLVVLAGHGHDPDHSLRSRQIPLELVQIRSNTKLFRLGALIFLVQIRSLEMNAQDLRSFYRRRVGLLQPRGFCNIPKGFRQHLLGLGDGRRKYAGHTLADNVLQPVPQPLLLCVICIKTICPVCVHINEARDKAAVTEIFVCRICCIRIDGRVFSIRDLNLCFHPLVQHPDSFTLQDHGVSFLSRRTPFYTFYTCGYKHDSQYNPWF